WKDFEPFARYGFNRAHAAIYGIIAYHTAYLKANYSVEYMTAVLSAEMGTPDRVAIAVAECRRMGINVLPPDVNESDFGFAITDNGIRFGLGAVKNVGQGAVEGIVEARKNGGAFRSLDDFCGRIDLQRCNKRVLESLIKCGATDGFGTRQHQLARLDAVMATAQDEQEARRQGQVALFDLGGTALGSIGSLVAATIFPRTYELTAPVWNTDEILLVLGRVEKRDEAPKILVEHAVRFDDQGMRDIKRVASETAERLARRSRFVRPGAMGAAPWGPAPAAGAPRRPTALTSTNGHGNGAGVSSARPSSEEQPSAVSPPGASPASPGASSADVAPSTPRKPTELVIRFRESLDYDRSIGTPVVVARPPGVLSLMNRAARELTGFEAHIGDRLDENMRIFPATDGKGRPFGESALLAALGGRESEGEATFKNFKTGEEHVVHWIA